MLCLLFIVSFIISFLFYFLFVLFCFVLFCFVLFCFVLFCFVLFCFVLFCFVLFCFVLFCFVLSCFVLFCLVLFCFVFSLMVFLGGLVKRMPMANQFRKGKYTSSISARDAGRPHGRYVSYSPSLAFSSPYANKPVRTTVFRGPKGPSSVLSSKFLARMSSLSPSFLLSSRSPL